MADLALQVRGLNVYYGHSHALQGVEFTINKGVLAVVGRNGMGKTTLCKTIMGLVRASSGSIRFGGEELTRLGPAQIARLGIGYVPQGRRLWRSLTVDEHLRATPTRRGAWNIERIYDTFPRLAERKSNGGAQLSGGEQQMLAISRALLANPKLLVMDEPTEGLAPVIVAQVEDMLVRLAESGEMAILVIEQNIGVATAISENVAIMVNGRINRVIEAQRLANDRALQQRLLGVGRHGHEDAAIEPATSGQTANAAPHPNRGAVRIFISNPKPPTRWSQPASAARIEAAARTSSASVVPIGDAAERRAEIKPLAAGGQPVVLVAGTLDTKGEEMRYIRDLLAQAGVRTRLIDLSTSGKHSAADVSPNEIALHHPRGSSAVFSGDRGAAVTAMSEAFETWVKRQAGGIAGIISAGGSGATALATPAMRALPVGVPKVMISTVASGDVRRYVGPADIMMMYPVTDVQGLNSISRPLLANGAQAMAGMAKARQEAAREARKGGAPADLPAIGLTMFGVTTSCVTQLTAALREEYDCLVFHATGVGGESMEKLVDGGLLAGALDITTTEVCDLLMGGILPATEDRFGAFIRTRLPYVGSCGALDMVNFGPRDTVPAQYQHRQLHQHNAQVTLMRTTPDENERMGRWIGERLNQMDGPVRFLLPEGGVSQLDAPGGAFFDQAADAALFRALEQTVRQTPARQLVRVPANINDPAFVAATLDAFRSIAGGRNARRRARG
jgi:uncharacterized protein (UPF0261 family)/ABC-type branched-subunit amino acid transport system ATPase component